MKIVLPLILLTVTSHAVLPTMDAALWPVGSDNFHPWQLLTYAFAHAGVLHLAANMLALLSFGPRLVREWGAVRFLACYAAAAITGGALQANVTDAPVAGASAAVLAVFVAWAVVCPQRKVMTLWPWSVTAWKLAVVYALLTILAMWMGWATSVAHAAHLGGMAIGLLFAARR